MARIETAEIARRVIDINLLGAIDTLHAVLPAMRARRHGHIALDQLAGGVGAGDGCAGL